MRGRNNTGSQRDDAIPFAGHHVFGDLGSTSSIEFIADYLFGHPRAVKLREKDLLNQPHKTQKKPQKPPPPKKKNYKDTIVVAGLNPAAHAMTFRLTLR